MPLRGTSKLPEASRDPVTGLFVCERNGNQGTVQGGYNHKDKREQPCSRCRPAINAARRAERAARQARRRR